MAKKQKVILRSMLERLQFCNSKDLPQTVNHNGRCMRWVGIGWIDDGEATASDTIILEDVHG